MATKALTEYKLAFFDAMQECHYLEAKLQDCLKLVIEIGKFQLAPVQMSLKDVSKLPLGALVGHLKFHQNASLTANLKQVVPQRNRLAHVYLDNTIGEESDAIWLRQRVQEMNATEKFVRRVREDVLEEIWKLHKMLLPLKAAKAKSQREAQQSCVS